MKGKKGPKTSNYQLNKSGNFGEAAVMKNQTSQRDSIGCGIGGKAVPTIKNTRPK